MITNNTPTTENKHSSSSNQKNDDKIQKTNERASVDQSTPSTPEVQTPNSRYREGMIQLEGAGVGLYSSEQITYGNESPLILMAGVRGIKWWNANGIEASIKTKLMELNQEGQSISPIQAEIRYHRRWFIPFNFFSPINETRVSLIGGYEIYRSGLTGSSASLFSPQYNLLKGGFAIALPFSKQWDTGGEILLGVGNDSSKKYEISGFFNYFLKTNWSFGFGYRMHLFEGGNESSPPDILPFKEGYGEGFSTLRWHY